MKTKHVIICLIIGLLVFLGIRSHNNKKRASVPQLKANGVTFKSEKIKIYKPAKRKLKPVALGLLKFEQDFKEGDEIKAIFDLPVIEYTRSVHKLGTFYSSNKVSPGYLFELIDGDDLLLPNFSFDLGFNMKSIMYGISYKLSDNTDLFIGSDTALVIGIALRL